MFATSSLVKSRAAPLTPTTLAASSAKLPSELVDLILGLQDFVGHPRQLLAVSLPSGPRQTLPRVLRVVNRPVGDRLLPATGQRVGAESRGLFDALLGTARRRQFRRLLRTRGG